MKKSNPRVSTAASIKRLTAYEGEYNLYEMTVNYDYDLDALIGGAAVLRLQRFLCQDRHGSAHRTELRFQRGHLGFIGPRESQRRLRVHRLRLLE